jgi:hypothetical protein
VIDVGFRRHPSIDGKVHNLPMDTSPDDKSSHGLRVMGIIGAASNNDCPIKGIAPNVTLFAYAQSVASEIDVQVILDNAEGLDEDCKKVSKLNSHI